MMSTNADCLTDSQLENVKSTVNIYKIRGSIHTKEKELIENCFGKGLKLCRDQRYDEAKKHLEIVKEAMEYPQFYFYYGLSCQKSNPPDYQKAFEAYKIAIEELPAARLNLANLYQQGLGTVKNEREAFKLLLKNYYYFDKKLEDCKSINNSNKYKVYISEVLKDDLDSYISNNYYVSSFFNCSA